MLLLFETSAGFALFKVLNEGKLQQTEDLWKDFDNVDSAQKVVKLQAFRKFENTTDALAAATSLVDSKLPSSLKKFLKKNVKDDSLGVLDAKLGGIIKEKLGLNCLHNTPIQELARGIRNQLAGLISGLAGQDLTPMSLGLSHSLSRYKLKFSPDKVDTMIVQAIGLLDDLDKELNTYAMRVREWYGWHFPEMAKVVNDNILYAKVVKRMRDRTNAAGINDFSDIPLEADVEELLKASAETSMGTEISAEDMDNIVALCDQVIALAEYRGQLFDYLKNRMLAIAPNLTVLVGELVGARLIAHAGSLINLAKQPASTLQILGAEKALFRALKTKHETPKYGLIYHATLIGQAQAKNKGKISRLLAAKCSLGVRCDALGEGEALDIGLEARATVERRLRQLEGRALAADSAWVKGGGATPQYDAARQGANPALLTQARTYNPDADVTADAAPAQEKEKKKKKKKRALEEAEPEEEEAEEEAAAEQPKKKKKKKDKGEAPAPEPEPETSPEKKKKKKRALEGEVNGVPDATSVEKKKKKKKKAAE